MNFDELLVDSFAGGGGASTGIEKAMGRSVDIAINHDLDAIRMHTVNHPGTRHFCESVWDVDPREVCGGRPVGLAWFSPDCRHFSKAKGGAPVSPRVRGLAWVVLKWIGTVRPRVIMLENVEEFTTWGPLVVDANGDLRPCPKRKGHTFNSFLNAIRRQGYQVEMRELRACDYGAPTIRKRLFLIARCDGQPIVWPEPTHGPGRLPYRTAAEIIDWSIPCPSIFERKKPLAEATCRRIAAGVMRYVVNTPDPFIVTYYGEKRGEFRGQSLHQPLATLTTENRHAVVQPIIAPFLTEHANATHQRNFSATDPLRTQCASVKGGHFALVSAFLAKHYTGVVGADVRQPLPTVTSVDHNAVVTSHLLKLRNNQFGQSVLEPMPTLTAGGGHVGEVRAFLMKYYGEGGQWQSLNEPMHTIPTRDRIGLVTVHGEPYQIVDIGMRMLSPRELFNAQGFPHDYVIEHDGQGKVFTKTAQVARCGNSVCPVMAEVLGRANMAQRQAVAA
ncbi:MAG: DNA cytosine methyltransferase [Gammaproteobacteria bacterium]|nr:DNA cytosine methyltransferase [Gammaproteobacteria bacterium]